MRSRVSCLPSGRLDTRVAPLSLLLRSGDVQTAVAMNPTDHSKTLKVKASGSCWTSWRGRHPASPRLALRRIADGHVNDSRGFSFRHDLNKADRVLMTRRLLQTVARPDRARVLVDQLPGVVWKADSTD